MPGVLGSSAIVAALKRQGVRYVFGLPGTAIMDIYDACYGDPDLKLITVRHEQGAGHMADGYARASGEVGVCLLSRGPGASNALIAIENAYHESSPVLALAGIPGTDIHAYDAFEEMDLVSAYRPVTKWAAQVPNGNRAAEFVEMAIRKARLGRPRPVFLAIPEDFQNREFESVSRKSLGAIYPPAAPREALAEVLRLIEAAGFPLILAGGGLKRTAPEQWLVRLAERLNLPVVTAWLRDDLMPGNHPLYLGSAGSSVWPATLSAMREADLVISLGCRFSEFTSNRFTLFQSDQKLVQVDIDPLEIGKIYSPDLGINAEARIFIKDLLAAAEEVKFPPRSLGQRQVELLAAFKAQREIPLPPSNASLVHPLEFIDCLNRIQSPDLLFVADAGNFLMWISKYARFRYPGSLIAPAGGAMGFGLPAAIGAQLARPDKRVVCIAGDGGFMMTMQEMETAARYRIPVVTVVLNNYAYANVKVKQQATYGGRLIGADLGNPDFAEFARLCGVYGQTVTRGEDLRPALEHCLGLDGPSLVNLILDPINLSPPGTTFFTSKGVEPSG